MAQDSTIKVALIRGDSLNEWEGSLWNDLGPHISVTGFCSKKNLYAVPRLPYPVKSLPTSTDHRLNNLYHKYVRGQFQTMSGLESALGGFMIAHTAEIYYAYTNQAVLAKKQFPQLKVVTTVWDNSFGRFEYNYWPGFGMPPAYWRTLIQTQITENATGVDMFLPVTEYSAQLLLDYGVPAEKITVLTPGIYYEQSESTSVIERLGLGSAQVYLMVNRLVKSKGVYDVLYAWRQYVRNGAAKDARLVIVGTGPEQANMVRLARLWGLESRIQFVGALPNHEVRQLYTQATCLILASVPTPVWQEQFGYVLGEAMASSCPIVAARSGAIPEVVGSAGIYFDAGNPVALAERLAEVTRPEMIATLKRGALAQSAKYTAAVFQQRLRTIYEHLV